MKTHLDCLKCFIQQTLDAVRLATPDERIQIQVIRDVLSEASKMNLKSSPPMMGQHIHRIIRRITGCEDPYKVLKDRSNNFSLELYPLLKKKIEQSLPQQKFETAVRISIAGNIIDSAVNSHLNRKLISDALEQSLSHPLLGDLKRFSNAINAAKKILYLGDNAGEIVFDRLFIERLPIYKITFVVRGRPILNDATMEDAVGTGMTTLAEVIDNGSDAPGTIIKECSKKFKRYFSDADLVIAKGQGNYETLSDANKNIFFLLKAKCPVIAEHIGCDIGSLVVRDNCK